MDARVVFRTLQHAVGKTATAGDYFFSSLMTTRAAGKIAHGGSVGVRWFGDRYKVLFGIVHINSDGLFTVINQPQLRGHKYTLVKPRCVSRQTRFFQYESHQYVEQLACRHNRLK